MDQIDELTMKWKDELVCIIKTLNTIPKLKKPLKCYWISQCQYIYDKIEINACDYHPIICVNASKSDDYNNRIYHSWDYIGGAGDDDKRWNKGLTPEIMYNHIEEIESETDKDELEIKVMNWIRRKDEKLSNRMLNDVKISIVPLNIYLSTETPTRIDDKSVSIINIKENEEVNEDIKQIKKSYIHYSLNNNKKNRIKWRYKYIPDIIKILDEIVLHNKKSDIFIVCDEIDVLGVCVLLVILCNYYDDSLNFTNNNINRSNLSKKTIHSRFCYIQQYINTNKMPRWLRQSVIAYYTKKEGE